MLLLGITAAAQPRFVADSDIIKTGEVLFQKPYAVVFGFTNKGNKPLHIKKVETSCGCAKATYTRGNIAPGERGEWNMMLECWARSINMWRCTQTWAENRSS